MKRVRNFLVTTILGGVVVILPMAILYIAARFLFNVLAGNLRPLVHWLGLDIMGQGWMVDILAIVLMLVFCFVVGLVVRTQMGLKLFAYFERNWLEKIPFYASVKETIQQFAGNKNYEMMQVVLVDAFDNGGFMTGFVTDRTEEHDMVTIFVPTGPNPTNGLIFHLPEDKVLYVDMKPEVAMKSIVSVGAGSSKLFQSVLRKDEMS